MPEGDTTRSTGDTKLIKKIARVHAPDNEPQDGQPERHRPHFTGRNSSPSICQKENVPNTKSTNIYIYIYIYVKIIYFYCSYQLTKVILACEAYSGAAQTHHSQFLQEASEGNRQIRKYFIGMKSCRKLMILGSSMRSNSSQLSDAHDLTLAHVGATRF